MKKLPSIIVKSKWIIIAVTAIIISLSVWGLIAFVQAGKINSDMLQYLPEKTATAKGIEFLKENFDVEGDAFVVVEGDKDDEALAESASRMKAIEGVTQVLWIGDVEQMEELTDNPLIGISGVTVNTEELKKYLKLPINPDDANTKYNYVFMVLFSYSPSTPEAFAVHDQIREILAPRSVSISGMTALADTVMTETLGEIKYYLVFSVIAVLIVLLLATSSFFEPIILLATLGISVLVNMGTNMIFPSVSIISFAACSVLQLGIAMDYAIFFMHIYKEKRKTLSSALAAEQTVIPGALNVLASGLTTIGGFLALCFMEFEIGRDIALVVVKGIVLSVLTVIFLQPCLTVVCDKLLQKTAHKELSIKVEGFSKKLISGRKLILVGAAVLIVATFVTQLFVNFSYLKVYEEKTSANPQEQLAARLANQIIIAVPLETKDGTHKEFIDVLESDERITNVMGAYTALEMEENQLESLLNLLIGDGTDVPAELGALNTLFRKVDGKWYTLYLLEYDGDTEDEGAFKTYEFLTATTDKYFAESYPLGILTGINDMASVTTRDFTIVSLFSAAIIFLIMALLLKSPLKSIAMVLLIELAIWLNISLNVIFGVKINFMVYILISSVQLGCTVDYGILMCTRFASELRTLGDSKQAAIKASVATFPAITVSASMIAVTCLTIVFVSKNLLVKEMAWMLARGAFISYLMVVLVLPSLLSFFKLGGDGRFLRRRKPSAE